MFSICCISLTAIESTAALVISIGAAVFSLVKYYKFEKRISKQELALNDIQLAEYKKEKENQQKADIQLSFTSYYKAPWKLKVYNKGLAAAESIEVRFLDDISLLANLPTTLRIERLDSLQNKDYDVNLINGHPREIHAWVGWQDEHSAHNTKTVMVFIQ